MRSLVTLIATAGLGLSLFPGTAQAAAPAPPYPGYGWHGPRCKVVTGDGSISFTRDAGHTIAPTTGRMTPVKYVDALEPLARPNHLLAIDHGGRLSRSRDAGCTWEQIAELPAGFWSISPTIGEAAYLWRLRGDRVYRVNGTRVSEGPAFDKERLGGLVTLTANRWRPWHLRGVTKHGRVLDSRNWGRSFRSIGAAPIEGDDGRDHIVYDAEVAPSRTNRIVIGVSHAGGFTSNDGGRHWRQFKIGSGDDRVNGFSVSMSPIDPRTVHLIGLNHREYDQHLPSRGRHLYRSTDGGRSFRAVVDHGGPVVITNGGLLEPSPWDRDIVRFEYSDPRIGTELYTHNARTGKLSINRIAYDGVKSLAFNPGVRNVMYLGFAEER